MDASLRDLERRFETDPTVAEAVLAAAERVGDRAFVRRTLDRCPENVVLAFVAVKRELEYAPIIDRFESEVAQACLREWWPPLARIVGRSPAMRALRAFVAEHARSSEPVMFVGENGVGRDLAAQSLHELSGRPWIHRGGHSGPLPPGGTYVVRDPATDELDRWLESSPSDRHRLIVCTEQSPGPTPPAQIHIAPLRDRTADLAPLIVELLDRRAVTVASVPEWIVRSLAERPWAGNVRELESVVDRARYLSGMLAVDIFDRWAWTYGVAP
jgi:transcriptional regulator of acetoin/glycerol metabolism